MNNDHAVLRDRRLAGALIACSLACAASNSYAAIPATERAALLAFYNATNGDDWTDNSGWLGTAGTECAWAGVGCDADESHVITLDLPGNGLAGQLPNLSAITELRSLNLAQNGLVGSIPNLSALARLAVIELRQNHLSGAFPYGIAALLSSRSMSGTTN